MNYKLLLTLFFLLSIFTAACDKDGNIKDEFDKSLLLDRKWYSTGGILVENGQIGIMTVDSCLGDNIIVFQASNHLLYDYGLIKCPITQPDTVQKWWHVIDGQLDMDNILYDVLYLSSDSMSLKRNIHFAVGMTGDRIERYYKN